MMLRRISRNSFCSPKLIVALAFLCLLLAACGGGQVVTPVVTGTAAPSLTATVKPPTSTLLPAPTSTPTSRPTNTSAPSQTPDLTLAATKKVATEARSTEKALAATEEAILGCDPVDRSYSPDGAWVAIECAESVTGVYNRSVPTITWQIDYSETFQLQYYEESMWGYMHPIHWSPDGGYLYLMPTPLGMDGGCPWYVDGMALLRLDLATGDATYTLSPAKGFYDVSFSRGGGYLAYFRNWIEPPALNLLNMVTGDEQYILLDKQYTGAGDVLWSPDGSRIVLSARAGEDCEHMTYSLIMIELGDLSQSVLLEQPDAPYTPLEWTEDDQIILDLGYSLDYGSLDLATGEVTPYQMPTPTAAP